MKKIKLNTAKLQLNKERIASLTNDEMMQIQGGTGTSSQRCMVIAATQSGTCGSNACQSNVFACAPNPDPGPKITEGINCAYVSVALKCY